jgi:hypothetical protein
LFVSLLAVLVAFWRSVVDFGATIREVAPNNGAVDWLDHRLLDLTVSSTAS